MRREKRTCSGQNEEKYKKALNHKIGSEKFPYRSGHVSIKHKAKLWIFHLSGHIANSLEPRIFRPVGTNIKAMRGTYKDLDKLSSTM